MSTARTDGHGVAGSTIVEARALQRLALGLVRDAAAVDARDVSVELTDHHGDLRVAVVVPVVRGRGHDDPVAVRGDALREAVVNGMRDLAARRVGAVDVRFAGLRREPERRVA